MTVTYEQTDFSPSRAPIDTMQAVTQRTLAECIWNFSWNDFLPASLPGDISLRRSHCDEMEQFARMHFQKIYQHDIEDSAFAWYEDGPNKRRFYQQTGDFVALTLHGQLIGMFVGNATDWGSYYLRNLSLLPEYQGRGIFHSFLGWYIGCLESVGVDRVESEVSISNTPSIRGSLGLGFVIAGQTLSDRWGAMIEFRKLLNLKNRTIFEKQYCHSRPRPHATDHGGMINHSIKEGAES